MRAILLILALALTLPVFSYAQEDSKNIHTKADKEPYALSSEGVLMSDSSGPIAKNRVKPPHLIHAVPPQFPEGRKKSLTCVFSGIVDLQGQFEDLQVVNCSQPDYAQSGEEALRQYTFHPALLDDKPTAMQIKVQINFRIFGRFW